MTSVTTRQNKYSISLDEKNKGNDDKYNSYEDLTAGDRPLELNTISEGSSGSSIAEMNNNTNGKVLNVVGQRDVNMNDNRKQMTETLKVQAPTKQSDPDSATVIKKIKQIYMDEVPLHLSGMSLSGSGMELFVKLDENLDKALRQANNVRTAKRKKKRKTIPKTNNLKNYMHFINTVPGAPSAQGQDVNAPNARSELGLPKEDGNIQNSPLDLRKRSIQNNEKMGELTINKNVDVVAAHSKQSVTERIRQLKVTPGNQKSYFPYGYNQNFQEQATSVTSLQCNAISGPIWNIENGQIDVIRPQHRDSIPSISNVQTRDTADYDAGHNDYSLNPFSDGFKSENLPLKGRISPPSWQIPKQRRDTIDVFEDLYQEDNNNISDSNFYSRKNGIRRVRDGKIRKLSRKRDIDTKNLAMPSTSQDKSGRGISEVKRKYLPNKDIKQTVSDVSNGQQSSVGPQFQTELLTPQTMDAETLIKFTEYTHDLRKDLRQKYKDLSKLLKAFEETVQQKNGMVEEMDEDDEENDECVSKVARCRIM